MRNQLLRDADWAGMAHSVEIRVPFVDADLFKSLAPLLVSGHPPGKQDLSRVPLHAPPGEVVGRVKTGFSIPVANWLAPRDGRSVATHSLRDWSRRVIANWPAPGSSGDLKSRRTVLVFRVGQLGDTLVSLPAIQDIRRRHPGDRLILLTDRHPGKRGYVSSWDVLGPTGWFDDVLFYVPKTLNWIFDRNLGSLPSLLRKLGPEIAYHLTPPRNAWRHYRDQLFMRGFVGVREVYDSGIYESPAREPGRQLPRIAPEWLRLRNVVPGEHVGNVDLASLVPREDMDHVGWLLREKWGCGPPLVLALGPGSKMPAKTWEEDRFLDLVQQLLAHHPQLHVVVLGGPEDREIGERLVEESGPRICEARPERSLCMAPAPRCYLAAPTSETIPARCTLLRCSAGRASRCSAPETILVTGNPMEKTTSFCAMRLNVPRACSNVCNEQQNKCMRLITVDEVYRAVAGLLGQTDKQLGVAKPSRAVHLGSLLH